MTERPPPDQRARTTVTRELDRTLFVEAGAGTGKTSQLVERIVELVLRGPGGTPVRLAEVAAITFTEAAAAELRDRVRKRFEVEQRKAQNDQNHERVRLCAQALEDADVAAISTLHSFAQRLLSEHPIEVGIPPHVEVVDEVQSQIDFEHRWSAFIAELFDDPDAEQFMVRAAILEAGVGRGHRHLRDLAHIFDDNWDRLGSIDEAPLVRPVDVGSVRDAVRRLLPMYGRCKDPADRLLERLHTERPILDAFLESESEAEQLRLLRRLTKFKASGGKAPSWEDKPAVVAAIDAVRTRAETVVAEIADETLNLLARRVARFTVDSADERRREGRLAFHDLLVLARKLLRESTEARRELSSRYRVLLLDEFQDTDPIQIELALLLADSTVDGTPPEWKKLQPDAGRVFMVGDPKQSIYRFRRADIALFLEARDKFGDGRQALTTNFRTVPEIIAATNGLFGELMVEATKAQPAYEPLHAHRTGSGRADHRPLVFGGPLEVRAPELRQAEVDEVAAIVDDIRRRPAAWPVLDDESGDWRNAELSDVTILLPTRTSLRQLTTALAARNIPYRADTGTLVYETQEVRDLLAALRAVDDPSDEIALVAALRSPLYGIGDDELYRFRTSGGRFDIRVAVPDPMTETPIAEAIEHLRSLAADKWWLEPSRLLLRIVEERGANVLALDRERSRDTWRRIRYVVDQARAFAEAGGGDLRAYLDWTSLQGVDGSKAHEPMLPEPDDDAVQIMTIHGAKGLEFPITIVSGLTTQMQSPARGVGVHWGEAGTMPEIRLNAANRTENFDARADLEAQMDRPEKDRLLYVALTRARDHLVVSGFHNGARNKDGTHKTDCHGLTVHRYATGPGDGLVRLRSAQGDLLAELAPPPRPQLSLPAPAYSDPVEWAAERDRVIDVASFVAVRSATALARQARGLDEEEPDADEDDSVGDEVDDADGSLPPRPFRRGRAGTAIGRAVHGVLQLTDLADPDAVDLDRLVASQAWTESVPEHHDAIARSVASALASPTVQACRSNRHHKELFVAAPVGSVTIEGYVDLLVDTPDGLIVVDYKTDSVHSEADVDAKLDQYSIQGAAYALAVETATGRPVVDVRFVFTRPDGPIERPVGDLESLRAVVRRLAGETAAAPRATGDAISSAPADSTSEDREDAS